MIMKESMRKRLQTLARALTKKNNIKVMPGLPSTDFSTIYLNDGAEIIPGLPCTRAEAWVVTKASCAHESAHILFTCKKTWEDYLKWAKEHYPLPNLAKAVLNCLEDGRAERAMALRYPQTELLFAFSNNYFFKHGVGREGDLPQFLDGLISLATVGDIPKRINNPTVIMLLNQCLPFIEKGVKGLHTKDAAYTSHKILEILEPHIKDAVSDIEDQSVSTGTYSPEKAPISDSDTRRRKPKRLKARVKVISEREKQEEELKEKDSTQSASKKEADEKPKTEPETEETMEQETTKTDSSGDADESEKKDEKSPTAPQEEPSSSPEEDLDSDTSEDDEPDFSDSEFEIADHDTGDSEREDESDSGADFDLDAEESDESNTEEPGKPDADDTGEVDTTDPEQAEDSGEEPQKPDDDLGQPEDAAAEEEDTGADCEPDADTGDSLDDFTETEEGEKESTESFGTGDKDSSVSGCSDSGTPYSFDDEDDEDDPIEELSELMEEASDELDMLDRQERKSESKGTERDITPMELCNSIDWNELHKAMKFDIIRHPINSDLDPAGLIKQVKPLAKKLAKEIKPYFLPKNNYPQRGKKRGRIDARALYKTSFNEDRVFYKKAEPSQRLDVAAYLLIDGSGSMSDQSKYIRAREAAMLCHLTLKELQIVHAATLFDAEFRRERHRGYMVRHEALINFSTSLIDNGANLMRVRHKSDNRDGYSIRIAAKELAMRPEKKKILLVLSDGEPYHGIDHYGCGVGQMDSRRAVIEAERDNIIVIGIHFGEVPSEAHKLMYPNLVYSKIEPLPSVLGATLKRALTK